MRITRAVPLVGASTVSVVVPCYNYGRYLPQLLRWVVDQPGIDVEVIIVDDASPDGSGDQAEELAADYEQVKVIRHLTNRGHIQTYNDGLEAVTGEFVTLLSADDLVPPGALSRAAALLSAHPDVGMVYGYAPSFSGEPPAPNASVRNWTIWSGYEWLRHSARRARNFISSPEVVMRTAALREVGLYDPGLPHSGDLDLWLRTALHWDIGRVNGPDQALYRVHDANMHLTTFAGTLLDLHARRTTFDLLFTRHARRRADIARLRPSVSRALAREAGRAITLGQLDRLPLEELQPLADFAVDTDPFAPQSRQIRRLRSGRRLRQPGFTRFFLQLQHHLRWRRERRYGI
ncbi:glycosyltransferase family 2 protein [Microlunatus soli]|uniref:Glycosyl transferase family 2 n=1 Tax=Microlunatus soli TaxID=630515 RepID=A0A1H1SNH7_9ACTN|nr:glycosyltransferase family 2 protein [Microlunatus soli]SDS49286.1 Glycosyl transferase family 2 [Microlunatus soli]